jgi:hypothetical protein
MSEINYFKVFVMCSDDVVADMDHLHVKRIHLELLVGHLYIVRENFIQHLISITTWAYKVNMESIIILVRSLVTKNEQIMSITLMFNEITSVTFMKKRSHYYCATPFFFLGFTRSLTKYCQLFRMLIRVRVRVSDHPRVFDPIGVNAGAILYLWVYPHPSPNRIRCERRFHFSTISAPETQKMP